MWKESFSDASVADTSNYTTQASCGPKKHSQHRARTEPGAMISANLGKHAVNVDVVSDSDDGSWVPTSTCQCAHTHRHTHRHRDTELQQPAFGIIVAIRILRWLDGLRHHGCRLWLRRHGPALGCGQTAFGTKRRCQGLPSVCSLRIWGS